MIALKSLSNHLNGGSLVTSLIISTIENGAPEVLEIRVEYKCVRQSKKAVDEDEHGASVHSWHEAETEDTNVEEISELLVGE